MLDLSPTKLIIIFVVAIVLLGPNRLPQVARQLGAAWSKARAFSQRMDTELRQSIPDLPSSRDLVRYARSPITLLNELADGTPRLVEDPAAPNGPSPAGTPHAADDHPWPEDRAGAPGVSPEHPRSESGPLAGAAVRPEPSETGGPGELALLAVDDPMLN